MNPDLVKSFLPGIVFRGVLWLLTGILIKRGYDAAQVDAWSHQLADFIVGGLMVVFAIGWSVWQKHRAAAAAAEAARPQGTMKVIYPPSPGANSWLLIIGLAVAMLLAAGGCGTTPLQRVVIARETYATTLDVLAAARQHGQINDTDYRNIEVARVQVAADLDDLERRALAHDAVGFDWYFGTFGKHLDQLLAWRVKTQSKG
jgi:hypothetical protein